MQYSPLCPTPVPIVHTTACSGHVFYVSLSVPLLEFMLNKIINYSSYYERSTFPNVQQTPGIKES